MFPKLTALYCCGCPWIDIKNPFFNSNMKKLKCLQRFCRNNLRYWRFRRWIRCKEFAEWFYSPKQWGGKIAKKIIRNEINNDSN